MIDMAVVGRYVDPTALAAISNTAMICFISALSIGFTVGGTVMTGVLLAGIHLFIRQFLGLFSSDPEVLDLGVLYLGICCSVNFVPYCVMHVLDSFAVGVGSPVFAMANSLFQSVVIRLGLSFALTTGFGYGFLALCIAEAVSPLPSALIALL